MQNRGLGFNPIIAANIALTIAVLLLLSELSPHNDPKDKPVTIDTTELKIYEEHFYKLFPGKKYSGTIYFKKDMGNKAGICYPLHAPPLFYTQIIISKKYWEDYTPNGKEELIAHELGHCLYGLDHDDEDIELVIEGITVDCPKTIMNSFSIGNTDCYKYRRRYYIDEFRKRIEGKNASKTK